MSEIDGLILPQHTSGEVHSWHLYVVRVIPGMWKISRNDLIKKINGEGIGTSVHYIPVHSQPYYRKIQKFQRKQLYLSEKHGESSLSIPVYPKLKNKEQFKIIKLINGFLKKL